MKKFFALLIGALLMVTLCFAVSAADHNKTVVYLKDGGEGDGSSPDSAFGTLTKCYDALDLTTDCTIVVCGPYTQSVNWVYYDKSGYTGSITFTSVYDGVDYRKTAAAAYQFKAVRFYCFGDTRFEELSFVCTGTNMLVVAQHNPVTVGEGVTMSGSGMTGGSVAKAFAIIGGWQNGANNAPDSDNSDTNITVLSGSKLYIVPFSRGIAGTYMGTANIKIGGDADVSVLHGSSVDKNGAKLGDVKIEITDKAHVGVFYGATNAVEVNSYDFTWEAGSIDDIQWNCKYTTSANITVVGDRVLNASPTAKKQANYSTIASNFDKVTEIADYVEEVDPNALRNATVVYVKDGGTGNGVSASAALDNLEDAYAALDLSKDCTIVIAGAFTQTETFDHGEDYTGSVTVTSVYGGTDYRKSGAVYSFDAIRYICYGDTRFENLDLAARGNSMLVVGQFNPVTIGAGVTVTGEKLTGTSVGRSFTILGGYQYREGNAVNTSDRDTNITVLSGSKLYIIPFTREILGDYSGTANIKIGGDADVGVLHGSSAYPDNIAVGDIKIEITDNAKIDRFYGCTQITSANSYEFVWKSGTINTFEWNCSATPAARLTVKGTKLLRASDTVKAYANFDAIAANFTTVAGLDDVVNDRSGVPVNLTEYGSARGLYLLGLAQGYDTTGTNFGLADKMTRVQTVVQVIRFLGVEDEVKAGNFTHPFTDVPAWAKNYVGYAYTNKITSGISATKFDPDSATTEAQYLTFMLRAIGYSDAAGDFTWSDPYAFANKIGMTPTDSKGIVFDRGDAFRFAWNALYADAKNGKLVKDNLIEQRVIGAVALNQATEEAMTAVEVRKSTKRTAENGYYVLSIEEYKDKTKGGLLAEIAAFLSGYEFAWNSDGETMRLAMPDSWFELCNGPYAERTSRNPHEDKLLVNEANGKWEVWNDDDFSIDILNQYLLADMYSEYGTFATKKITDGWVKYDVWDMGGGHRRQGAYGLMKKYGYLPSFAGNREYGNLYNVNGEPYIANETLAFSAAGMPDLAVKQASVFGSATSDRDPILWMQYFTALISMAYIEDDIPAMMREAQEMLPEGSWQDQVVDMVFDLYEQYPDDWRRAVVNAERMVYQKHYDLSHYRGETSINCSFILIGLLYGEGDFYETCKIIGLAGHGGDSTTATGVAVVAAICGWEGFDETSKQIINEKIWQDGTGVIVNRNVAGTDEAYWMFCAGLPERLALSDILDMYQANFERNLLANGGKIENGNYYIPENTLSVTDTVFVDEFEHGNLDGYTISGTVENAIGSFSGDRGAKISGGAKESSLTKTITGLTAGEDYRLSAFVSTSASTTVHMFVENGGAKEHVTVYDQTPYVKRELVFTAASDAVTIGFAVPAGTASHRYAIIDEINLIRVAEQGAGSVSVTHATKDGTYTGTVDFNVYANTKEEVLLKLTFANANADLINATVQVNGESYAGVPFHRTGSADGCGVIYVPVIAKDTASYTVSIDFGSYTVSLYDAEIVTLSDKF